MRKAAIAILVLMQAIVPAFAAPSDYLKLDLTHGRRYVSELANSIREADRILITEHSFDYDAYDGKVHKSLLPAQVVYAQRELTLEQRTNFANTVARQTVKPRYMMSMCLPEPHHTLTFYRSGQVMSVLRVCLECGQSKWSANDDMPPVAVEQVLSRLVRDIGLHPHLDWKALARTYLAQRATLGPGL